jgi:hypothetical protein
MPKQRERCLFLFEWWRQDRVLIKIPHYSYKFVGEPNNYLKEKVRNKKEGNTKKYSGHSMLTLESLFRDKCISYLARRSMPSYPFGGQDVEK